MYYESVNLSQEIIVNKIVSIHYFEYMSNFSFPGETHDFWEFLYVDKGEVQVIADDKNFTFKKGQIIFHKPNEFHALKANGRIAPNNVVNGTIIKTYLNVLNKDFHITSSLNKFK